MDRVESPRSARRPARYGRISRYTRCVRETEEPFPTCASRFHARARPGYAPRLPQESHQAVPPLGPVGELVAKNGCRFPSLRPERLPNCMARPMSPSTESLPDMNAAVGLRSPSIIDWKVSASAVRVTSAGSSSPARAPSPSMHDRAFAFDHEFGGTVAEKPPPPSFSLSVADGRVRSHRSSVLPFLVSSRRRSGADNSPRGCVKLGTHYERSFWPDLKPIVAATLA